MRSHMEKYRKIYWVSYKFGLISNILLQPAMLFLVYFAWGQENIITPVSDIMFLLDFGKESKFKILVADRPSSILTSLQKFNMWPL